jgi:hypothetical protein
VKLSPCHSAPMWGAGSQSGTKRFRCSFCGVKYSEEKKEKQKTTGTTAGKIVIPQFRWGSTRLG